MCVAPGGSGMWVQYSGQSRRGARRFGRSARRFQRGARRFRRGTWRFRCDAGRFRRGIGRARVSRGSGCACGVRRDARIADRRCLPGPADAHCAAHADRRRRLTHPAGLPVLHFGRGPHASPGDADCGRLGECDGRPRALWRSSFQRGRRHFEDAPAARAAGRLHRDRIRPRTERRLQRRHANGAQAAARPPPR
jgi:hypothetical protein